MYKSKIMKSYLIAFLILSMSFLLCACGCKHDSVGGWEVVNEAGVLEQGLRIKRCTQCGEILFEEPYMLDSYIRDGFFIFDVNEFSELMNIGLKMLDENCSASSVTSDVLFTSTGRKLSLCALYESGESFGSVVFLSEDYSDGFDNKDLRRALSIIDSDEPEHMAWTIMAMIMSCDPSLSLEETKELSNALLSQLLSKGSSSFTRNGLTYTLIVYPLDKTQLMFTIKIE